MKASSKGRPGGWVVPGKGGKGSGDQSQELEDDGQSWGCPGDTLAWQRAAWVWSMDGKNLGLPECVLQWCHRLLEVSSLLSAPSPGEAGSVNLPLAGLSELSFH